MWDTEFAGMGSEGRDLFNALTTGATFDKRRFRKQVDIFKDKHQGGAGRLGFGVGDEGLD